MSESTQTRKDKSDSKYTKPHPYPYIFAENSKDVGTGLCVFIITVILSCLCTFWHAFCFHFQ